MVNRNDLTVMFFFLSSYTIMVKTWQHCMQYLSPRQIWLTLAMTNKKMRCNQKQKELPVHSFWCARQSLRQEIIPPSSTNPLAKSIKKCYRCTYSGTPELLGLEKLLMHKNKYYTSHYMYQNLRLCNLIALNTLHNDLWFFSIFWKCLPISHLSIYKNEEPYP